jgi:stearoyl-CoA desaturase (delta-9 desaturase)
MTVELSERAAPEGAKALLAADRAANFWPLTVLSFGASWHNSHHADPTCARHGVLPGQVDPSARLTWLLEKFGWVFDVRWPKPQRFAALRTS